MEMICLKLKQEQGGVVLGAHASVHADAAVAPISPLRRVGGIERDTLSVWLHSKVTTMKSQSDGTAANCWLSNRAIYLDSRQLADQVGSKVEWQENGAVSFAVRAAAAVQELQLRLGCASLALLAPEDFLHSFHCCWSLIFSLKCVCMILEDGDVTDRD